MSPLPALPPECHHGLPAARCPDCLPDEVRVIDGPVRLVEVTLCTCCPLPTDATAPETPQDRRQGDNAPSRDSMDPPGGSQGHSEALTARVAAVIWDAWVSVKGSGVGDAAREVLDLLAAEGRLCNPESLDDWRAAAAERGIQLDDARAEVVHVRSLLAESQRIAKAATDGWTRSAAQNLLLKHPGQEWIPPRPGPLSRLVAAWRKAGRA